MAITRTFTLKELAAVSGRSYSFWDRQCRTGAIRYLQPGGPKGTRLITEAAYLDWLRRVERRSMALRPPPMTRSRSRGLTFSRA